MAKHIPTIHELRKTGYKVRVLHGYQLEGREGTKIEITSPEGSTAWGISYCHPKEGNNRKMGNKIALGRALKALEGNLLDKCFKRLNVFFGT
jgi:hypothetical protein